VKVAAIAAENVRKEQEQQSFGVFESFSTQSTSAQQASDKAKAKSWIEKFLATEEKEGLQEKVYKGPSKGKEKEKTPGRPRSKSIRLGRNNNNNSDADESEDWEKDYADLTGSYFEEPKEWLIAQGFAPKEGPPPSPRPKPFDGELEDGSWDIPAITAKMNNSYNFDPNMNPNAARQAPNAQQAQQLNGINGAQHWPNVGAQADMNVLWEYIQNLSQMHEGIRAQTQHVLNGVQQIQARAADDGGAAPHVNGVSNGILTPLPFFHLTILITLSNRIITIPRRRNRPSPKRTLSLQHQNRRPKLLRLKTPRPKPGLRSRPLSSNGQSPSFRPTTFPGPPQPKSPLPPPHRGRTISKPRTETRTDEVAGKCE
jgi:hypothetical protein